MKVMELIKEIDIFGTDIHWKLFKKEKFKSIFGGLTTIGLFCLFVFKMIAFIYKVLDNGFAKERNYFEKNGTNETLDISNMSFILDFKEFADFLNLILKNSTDSFSMRDYMEVYIFSYDDFTNKNNSCNVFKDHNVIFNKTSIEINFKLNNNLKKCKLPIKFDKHQFVENFLIINLLKKENLLNIFKQKQILTDYQYDLTYKYHRVNEKDFNLEEVSGLYRGSFSLNYVTETKFSMRKISVEKKFGLDFIEFLLDEMEGFEIDNNSFRYKVDKMSYEIDLLSITLDTFKKKNEILLSSLDDIVSVMGGFIQIILFLAEFILGIYNDYNANMLLNEFYYENLRTYDKKLNDLKMNVRNQIKMIESDYDNKKQILFYGRDFSKNKKLFRFNQLKNLTCEQREFLKNNKESCDSKPDDEFVFNVNQELDRNSIQNIQILIPKFKPKNGSYKKISDNNKSISIEKQIEMIDFSCSNRDKNQIDKTFVFSDRSKIEEKSISNNNQENKSNAFNKKEKPSFIKKIKGKNFLNKKILNFNKKKKKFAEFDFFDYIDIEIFLNLVSGLESLKFLLFDKTNKINFEKISDLFITSENCHILDPKNKQIDEIIPKKINENDLQKEILKRLEFILDGM